MKRKFVPSATRSLKSKVLNVRIDEDFLMRAMVRAFSFVRVWPALENLSGRKPRGAGWCLWGKYDAGWVCGRFGRFAGKIEQVASSRVPVPPEGLPWL